jgi:hypothetical protein
MPHKAILRKHHRADQHGLRLSKPWQPTRCSAEHLLHGALDTRLLHRYFALQVRIPGPLPGPQQLLAARYCRAITDRNPCSHCWPP